MLSLFLASVLTAVPLEDIAPVLFDYAQPRYSQNEEHLAYLAPDERGAYNLHVDGKCLTHTRRSICILGFSQSFFWETDNAHILYLYDETGDENYHLYRVDLEGNSEDLTPFPEVHVEFVGVDKECPDQALIRMNLRDPRYMDCYHLDLQTKAVESILPCINHREAVIAGDHLTPQVAMNFEPSGKKLLQVYEEGKWRTFFTLDPEDWYAAPISLTSDKKKLILLASMDQPTRGLYTVDLKTGAKELLFSHPKLDCLRGYFHPENGTLQAAYVRDGLLEWHFFDPEFEQELQGVQKKLPQGEILLLSRLSKDRKWLLMHRCDDRPSAYYLLDRDTKELKLVLQEAPELLKYTFGKMESFHFQASDGQEIQGYFLRPPSGEPPYPTILQVHGGPHGRDVWGFLPHAQYLASQGYATLFINFRGSIGFGKQFFMADKGEWGRSVFQDLIDGKRWAVEQGWVDPNKVAIKGGSYGGYSALLGISLTPDEFICGIADYPIVEPSTWMPQGYVAWGFTFDKLHREGGIGAKSPLSYAHQIKVPLLMTHAKNDLRVRPDQSQKMAELLKLYQIPFTYHVLPGDGHGFLDPDNREFYFREVDNFLSEQFNK